MKKTFVLWLACLAVLPLTLALTLGPVAAAQTQHGAAPDDQRLTLPPLRPADMPAGPGAAGPGDLFPTDPDAARILRISTGPIRGGYYAVGGVICDLVNRETARHRIECLVKPTSGSGENIAHVLSGGAEMGLAQSDWQNFAVTSAEDAVDTPLEFGRLRSIAALYPLATQVVVTRQSGVRALTDLRGRRLGLTRRGTGQRQLSEVVLAQAGVRLSTVQLTEFETDADMVRGLCGGQIDALILVGPAPMQAIDVALTRCDAMLISLDEALVDTLIGGREALAKFSVGVETYDSLQVSVNTIGYVVTLVTSASLTDTMAAEVARALNDNVPAFANAYPALASVDGSGLFSDGLTASIHDGVARYLDTLAGTLDIDSVQSGDSQ